MNFHLFSWLHSSRERSLASVPGLIIVVIVMSLLTQIALHASKPEPVAYVSKLASPPQQAILELLSLGEPIALAKVLMLKLQAFDNQPGVSIPLRDLDYGRVIEWLDAIVSLDPAGQYPLMAAMRIYAEVQDDDKRREMMSFVHRRFLEQPNDRWAAMVHAVFVAKHRLKDLDLALEYAKDIRVHVTRTDLHSWVRQMELFVLEDLGKVESARILLGGFLESGIIKDDKEYRYLQERLGIVLLDR